MVPMLLALALAAPKWEQQQLHAPGEVLEVRVADFDGDGKRDLLLVYKTGAAPSEQRWFALHRFQDGRLQDRPELFEVPEQAAYHDVCALPAGGPKPVETLLVIGDDQVRGYRWRAGKLGGDPEVLVPSSGLAVFAQKDDLPHWRLCRDWNGDGTADILLPDVGRTSLYVQQDGRFVHAGDQRVRPEAYYGTEGSTVYGPFSNRNLSVQVTHVLPSLVTGRYDDDAHWDLFAIQEDRVQVYLGDGRTFAARPKAQYNFRIQTPEELTQSNVYVQSHAVDVNKDGRLDIVVNKITGSILGMTSETRVYLNQRGQYASRSDQRIQLDHFGGLLRFVDLDKDGLPEMLMPQVEVGLGTMTQALLQGSMDVEYNLLHNLGGAFDVSSSPTLEVRYQLDLSNRMRMNGSYLIVADYNGDGVLDVALGWDGEAIHVHLGKGDGSFGRVASEITLRTSRYLAADDLDGDGRAELVQYHGGNPELRDTVDVLMNRGGW